MTAPDDPLSLMAAAVIVALLGFELAVALASWLQARDAPRRGTVAAGIAPAIWLPRPVVIRSHLSARQREIAAMRRRCAPLRSPGYGHQLRAEIRQRAIYDPSLLRRTPTRRP
jgi:hypothetical protein